MSSELSSAGEAGFAKLSLLFGASQLVVNVKVPI